MVQDESSSNMENSPTQTVLDESDVENCSCDKKQCMIGIASIAIGVGGFAIAFLL